MKNKKLIVGIGEVLWDVYLNNKNLGGAPANFAYHVSRLGFDSLVISAIGNDELGLEVKENLKRKKLKFLLQKNENPTGVVNVNVDKEGIPQFDIKYPSAWDILKYEKPFTKIAKDTSAVCFGTLAQRDKITADTIKKFVKMVPEDAYKIFDINLRQNFYNKQQVFDSLEVCNVLKINEQELSVVAEMFEINGNQKEISKILINKFHLKLIILTCGSSGSYLIKRDSISFIKTPVVKVVDTTGAGDSFTAAVVAGLLSGKTIEETHQFAVKLSAFVCTKKGAMPAYKTFDI